MTTVQASSNRRAAPGAEHVDRYHEVLVALRRIIRATDMHSKHVEKVSGLTVPQVVVLQSVRDLGEVTAGLLSTTVHLSQGTVSTILDRLERRGLIERYRSIADRRVVHARLTAQGHRVLDDAPPPLQTRFIRSFSGLDGAEQSRIVQTLVEIACMMGADEIDAAPLLDVAPVGDES